MLKDHLIDLGTKLKNFLTSKFKSVGDAISKSLSPPPPAKNPYVAPYTPIVPAFTVQNAQRIRFPQPRNNPRAAPLVVRNALAREVPRAPRTQGKKEKAVAPKELVTDQDRFQKTLANYKLRYNIPDLRDKHLKILSAMERHACTTESSLKKYVRYGVKDGDTSLQNDIARLVTVGLVRETRSLSGKKKQTIQTLLELSEIGKTMIEEIYPELVEEREAREQQVRETEQKDSVKFDDSDLADLFEEK